MATAARLIKSFTLDPEIVRAVEKSRGSSSASERVNTLLRIGLEAERQQALASEAEAFFAHQGSDRGVRKAFQQAGIKSMDGD